MKRLICVMIFILVGCLIGINLSFGSEQQNNDEQLLLKERLLSQQNQFAENLPIDSYGNLKEILIEMRGRNSFSSSFSEAWFSHNPSDLYPIKGSTWIFTFTIGSSTFQDTITFGNSVITISDGTVALECSNQYGQTGAVFYADLVTGGRGYTAVIDGSILVEFYGFNINGNTAYGTYWHKVVSTGRYSDLYDMNGVKISGPSQTQCRADNLSGCTNQTECEGVGGYWYYNVCNASPQTQCRADNLSGCTNQTECEGVGGYWYYNVCNASPKPAPSGGGHNAVPSSALSIVDFPTSVTPSNYQVQVGNCNDVVIQPTLAVPSSDVGKTATLIMYIYLPDANFGMNVPSKTKVLTSETKFDLLSNAIDFSDGAGLNVYIYYGYMLGGDIKYNAYSIVVGSSCSNQVPDCGSITDKSSCNANANCEWQAFPSARCILKCSQFTDEGTCNGGFNGGCGWSHTAFGDLCLPK